MTPTDLRLQFKKETGYNAIYTVDSRNRHTWLSNKYVKWLEGTNEKIRQQFKKETGLNALYTGMCIDFPEDPEKQVYKDCYRTWLEETRLNTYNIIEQFKK
jgi:hypothetical protein